MWNGERVSDVDSPYSDWYDGNESAVLFRCMIGPSAYAFSITSSSSMIGLHSGIGI